MEYGKDLERLMNELQGDKLQQEPPKTVLQPEIEEVEEEPEFVEAESAEPGYNADDEQPNIKDVSGLPELIVGIIDIFGAKIAEVWTKTEDKSKYRLEPDEKTELVKAWKMYLKNSPQTHVSPSTMLLMTTAIIYVPKAIMAIDERKTNLRSESI